ncbi:MAG: hypothetical protein SGARI_005274, partial [Bacillariaceae sp.]
MLVDLMPQFQSFSTFLAMVDGRFAQVIHNNLLAQMPNGTVAVGAEFGGVTMTWQVWEAIGDALNGHAGNISSLFTNSIFDSVGEDEAIAILNTICLTFQNSPLDTLNVQNNALPPHVFRALRPLLGPNLVSIVMTYCGLFDVQLGILVECVDGAVNLCVLQFDRNQNMMDQSAVLISRMMKRNNSLLNFTVSS